MAAEKLKIDLETSNKGYKGRVVYRGLEFRWTLNSQKDGGFRGQISVYDLSSGKKVSFTKKQPYAKKGAKEIRQTYRELNLRAASEKEIRNYISDTVQGIYADNERPFLRMLRMSVTSETITIGLACELYGTEYINSKYPDSKEETKIRYFAQLKEDLSILSTKPMAYYSDHPSEAMRILNKAKTSTAKFKTVSEFWDFAIYKGKYIQKNPITIPEADSKRRKPGDSIGLKKVPEETNERVNSLMLERHAGKDCGAAMVFSGFSLVNACSFYWRDIAFPLLESHDYFEEIEIDDFCVVLFKRPDLMIAVHDYRRPFIITCAKVLFLRLKELLETYNKEELFNMPVVSISTDPHKAMPPKALQSAIKELLLEAGIEDKVLKLSKESRRDPVSSKLLLNTYENDLINKCKLIKNSGTYNYLLGHSLGDDTTSTNYASFSDEKAQIRLYKILRRARQKCKIESPPRVLREEYGREIATVSPEFTDEVAGDVFELILQPGEEVVVTSPSGMHLDIKVIKTVSVEDEKAG